MISLISGYQLPSSRRLTTIRSASFAAARTQIAASVSPGAVAAVLGYAASGLVYDVVVRSPAAIVGGGPFDAPIFSGQRIVWQRRTP